MDAEDERCRERRLRSGLTLLLDIPGSGELVRRQRRYRVRLRYWLNRGDPVRWTIPSGPVGVARLEDNGETLMTELHVNRGSMMNGLFYGIDGMYVGGTCRLEIAPQPCLRRARSSRDHSGKRAHHR